MKIGSSTTTAYGGGSGGGVSLTLWCAPPKTITFFNITPKSVIIINCYIQIIRDYIMFIHKKLSTLSIC